MVTQTQRNKKIIAAIEADTKRALSSPESARETLVKEGIYTVRGNLRSEFGGTPRRKKEAAHA